MQDLEQDGRTMLKSFMKHARPLVLFDARRADHRYLAAEFMRTDTWGNCAVRFDLEPGYDNLVSMIENKLAAYYLSQEFAVQVLDQGAKWQA